MATTDFTGVDDPEVGDRGDVDADVVAGDDPLGLDRHGHDAQRDPLQPVDDRDDDAQAGFAHRDHPAEPEMHAALVLLHDPHRGCEKQRDQRAEGDERDHVLGPMSGLSHDVGADHRPAVLTVAGAQVHR